VSGAVLLLTDNDLRLICEFLSEANQPPFLRSAKLGKTRKRQWRRNGSEPCLRNFCSVSSGAKFKSSGCGFAVAAADVLTEKILDCRLTDLHGLDKNELKGEIETRLEEFPEHRAHCREMCFDALRAALADFRSFQIEEFAGEKLLICTCFGVSEEEIEKVIEEYQAVSVEEVSDVCNAGTGCGSCQFLIQEMIDIYWTENV
jgi:bacterioferritin-associated ferredoxin